MDPMVPRVSLAEKDGAFVRPFHPRWVATPFLRDNSWLAIGHVTMGPQVTRRSELPVTDRVLSEPQSHKSGQYTHYQMGLVAARLGGLVGWASDS